MIRLLIADDHQIILDGFQSFLRDVTDMKVVAVARNGQEVLDVLETTEIDVIVLDINMPELNGVEVCKRVSKKYPHTQVIALSMYKRKSYIQRMIQFGARGYLLKDDSSEEIQKAIRSVVGGSTYFSSQIDLSLLPFQQESRSLTDESITQREVEVLQLIAQGLTNQEIAEQLFLSQHTVESHRKNLLSKLNAKNTADLVRLAMEKGLI